MPADIELAGGAKIFVAVAISGETDTGSDAASTGAASGDCWIGDGTGEVGGRGAASSPLCRLALRIALGESSFCSATVGVETAGPESGVGGASIDWTGVEGTGVLGRELDRFGTGGLDFGIARTTSTGLEVS